MSEEQPFQYPYLLEGVTPRGVTRISMFHVDETGVVDAVSDNCCPGTANHLRSSCRWFEGKAEVGTQYFKGGSLLPRQNPAVEIDGNILRNLPAPCRLLIGDDNYWLEEPEVELEFDLPGPHPFRVFGNPRFLDFFGEIP